MGHRTDTRGVALISALVFLAIVAVFLSIASISAIANRSNAANAVRTSQVQLAAEAGLERAVYEVWHRVWQNYPGFRTMDAYRTRLGALGLANGASVRLTATLPNHATYAVTIRREDRPGAVHFHVTSTATLPDGRTRRTLAQEFYVQGGLFKGFDFALLTNNANCIFCHTKVYSLDAFKGPPSSGSPWKKAKVAALDTLLIRANSADTLVAGTIYTRGRFLNKDGTPITDPTTVDVRSLLAPGSGNIVDQAPRPLSPVDCASVGACTPNQNFYYHYPTSQRVKKWFGGQWPDGELPDTFPLPLPDDNGNRLIDDAEWNTAVSKSLQGLDPDNPPGVIQGGVLVQNPTGLTAWPAAGNVTRVNSGTRGSYLLDGSAAPLEIRGTVFIDGDVFIRGRIRGEGKIIARGNIYVLGDLVYDCGLGAALQACDYANPDAMPKFALAAVGNILIGDYLTPKGGNITDPNDIDPGKATTRTVCKKKKKKKKCKKKSNAGSSFTMSEITLFNRAELLKAIADPGYVPRFYRLRPGDPLYFWPISDKEHGDKYSDFATLKRNTSVCASKTKKGGCDRLLSASEVNAILDRAVVYDLAPKGLSETALKRLWIQSVQQNPARAPGALRTDGLLYSANAIFALARSANKYGSKLQGQWDLRGALVAADTGILVPGGITIYHDYRLARFLKIRNTGQVRLYRSHWRLQ